MNCTRCEGTGFLNLEQVPDSVRIPFDLTGNHDLILDWIAGRASYEAGCYCSAISRPPCTWCEDQHDVQVCDCCGDGYDWHGVPGEHSEGGDCQ